MPKVEPQAKKTKQVVKQEAKKIQETKVIQEKVAVAPVKTPAKVVTEKIEYVDHVVRKGDVLEKIARNYKTSVEEIVEINRLSSTTLQIGQELRLPKNSLKKKKKQQQLL